MFTKDRVHAGMGDEDWIFHSGCSLRYRGRVVVPHSIDLREEILKEFHCSRFSVHPGGTKMYQYLRRQYYWSGLKRHVGNFVQRCLMCQQVKVEHHKLTRLLDFLTHLPQTS